MRPRSIVLFEQFYLGAWALGLVNTVLNFSQAQRQVAEASDGQINPALLYGSTAIGLLIPIILWFFIARRGSVIAKWVLVVLFALGLGGIALSAMAGRLPSGLPGILAITATVLQGIGIWCLFRPDARLWFGETPAEVES